MKRRELLLAAGAAAPSLAGLGVLGAPLAFATAGGHVTYSREAYEQALASGAPFMLDFFANW